MNIIRNIFVPSLQGRARVGLVLFILSFLHFFITSCSNDQPEPKVKQTPIAFSANQQEKEVTRAGSTPLGEKRSVFKVWGYKNMANETQTVMEGYNVQWVTNTANTSTTNTNNWDYILTAYPNQTPKYWDWEAKAYRFFGITNGITGAYNDNSTKESYSFTFAADASDPTTAPYYSKLWVTEDNTAFGKPVQLEFLQPFAWVRFMITLSDPTQQLKLEDLCKAI